MFASVNRVRSQLQKACVKKPNRKSLMCLQAPSPLRRRNVIRLLQVTMNRLSVVINSTAYGRIGGSKKELPSSRMVDLPLTTLSLPWKFEMVSSPRIWGITNTIVTRRHSQHENTTIDSLQKCPAEPAPARTPSTTRSQRRRRRSSTRRRSHSKQNNRPVRGR